jgi:hypothetical protein
MMQQLTIPTPYAVGEVHIYTGPPTDTVKIKHHHKRLDGIEGLLLELGFDARYVERFRQTVVSAGVFPSFPQRYHVVEEADAVERLGLSFLSCPGRTDRARPWSTSSSSTQSPNNSGH